VAPAPVTRQDAWDRAAFDEMRARLHARFDGALAPAAFTIEAVRRPTSSGLTRVVLLRRRGTSTPWDVDTRTWTAGHVQHRTLAALEADLTAALSH